MERNNKKEATKAKCFISDQKLEKCPICKRKLVLKFIVEEYMDNADCPCGLTIKILWNPEVPEDDGMVEEGLLQ